MLAFGEEVISWKDGKRSGVYGLALIEPISASDDPHPASDDPHPALVDPRPALVDPRPALVDPQPVVVDPRPAVVDPHPPLEDPQPALDDPQPALDDPQPALEDPQPALDDPHSALVDPHSALVDPHSALVDAPAKPRFVPVSPIAPLPGEPFTTSPTPQSLGPVQQVVDHWRAQRCLRGIRFTEFTKDLHNNFLGWAAAIDIQPMSERFLVQNLMSLGDVVAWRHPKSRRHGFRGLRLIISDDRVAARTEAPPIATPPYIEVAPIALIKRWCDNRCRLGDFEDKTTSAILYDDFRNWAFTDLTPLRACACEIAIRLCFWYVHVSELSPVLRDLIEISDAVKALKFTKDRREVFLRALAETGIVTIAAGAAGITRARAYQVRQQDQGFATAWDEAEQRAADALEAEAWRRAVSGVPEPLVSAGKVVRDDDGQPLAIRRYSDNLLIALLKARRPEKFKDRQVVEHDISDGLADRLEAAMRRDGGIGPTTIRRC